MTRELDLTANGNGMTRDYALVGMHFLIARQYSGVIAARVSPGHYLVRYDFEEAQGVVPTEAMQRWQFFTTREELTAWVERHPLPRPPLIRESVRAALERSPGGLTIGELRDQLGRRGSTIYRTLKALHAVHDGTPLIKDQRWTLGPEVTE